MGQAARRKRNGQTTGDVVAAAMRDITRIVESWPSNSETAKQSIGNAARGGYDAWRFESPTIIRFDPDFLAVLAATDATTPLGRNWVTHIRFPTFIGILTEPLALDDGEETRHYRSFLACGYRVDARATAQYRAPFFVTLPIGHPDAEGIRIVWFCRHDNGAVGGQTMALDFATDDDETIGDYIARVASRITEAGAPAGEVEHLGTLALQTIAWLTAAEPDLADMPDPVRVPSASVPGPKSPKQAHTLDGGFRIGGKLREAGIAAHRTEPVGDGTSGWSMPPHVRAAHFHRVRVATRGDDGEIVGDRLGEEGVDWHYQLRWYPPAIVNASSGDVADVRTAAT